MTHYPLFQVDAFTNRVFSGNPAAVVALDTWLDDSLMQSIALENNLSETAFFVPMPPASGVDFHIRWFTPEAEVPLCGHATLASAWVIFNRLGWPNNAIRLQSRSGPLGVTRLDDGWLELDFPSLPFHPVATPDIVCQGLPEAPATAFVVPDDVNYLVVLANEAAVRAATPDMAILKSLGNHGLIITAAGDHCDFVSRYFAPGIGIHEDPVTGSIHSVLTPYWAQQLGKTELLAHQLSTRGGVLKCTLRDDRVGIAGQAAFFMSGEFQL
ncbi:PhzF family phenazine biosynthesis protein [Marinobacter caseinilyticus]|uniref:PhzF family phenazine biosynthesis protein n=1 Tax=Marinobacter caseinilyticus TaxID=2692195 RepID=UPI00140C7128|nr:PhzF family phenazine biosynthesis protein [Marinobacter caseinilyticus]